MAQATSNLIAQPVGKGGFKHHYPVKAATRIFEGIMVAQLTSGGMAVPGATASSGDCIGISQFEANNSGGADGDERIEVESERTYVMPMGGGGDAFTEADKVGILAYMIDDHTVGKTDGSGARKIAGIFRGMDPEGVRIEFTQKASTIGLANTLPA